MKSSQFSRITDELLSAYLDNDLSHQERELVDAAVAADDQVAWRLESLRQTVQLLSNLPDVAPTRSFLLDDSMVGDITTARRQAAARRKAQTATSALAHASATSHLATAHSASAHPATPEEETNSVGDRFRRGWRAFWQNGNPLLRNLATISLVLTIFVAGADTLLLQPATPASPSAILMQQEPQAASAPAASEMAAEMTSDTETPGADASGAPETGPANEEAAVAMRAASIEENAEDSAAPEDATGGQNDSEEPAMAAMAAPPLATPELADGATGDAAVGTPSADLAPIDGDGTADATADVAAEVAAEEVPVAEGGFGDADVAAPLILQGEATGMGSGGGAGSGGMGGGSDAPPIGGGGGGGGSGGDGTEGATVIVPLTPNPSEAFATGMLTESESTQSDSTGADEDTAMDDIAPESADESAPETMAQARLAPAPEEATGEEASEKEEFVEDATSEEAADEAADNPEAGIAESSQPAESSAQERVAILAPPAETSANTESDSTESASLESSAAQPVPNQSVPAAQLTRIFTWLQWGLVFVAATFGLLWWRSRNE